MTLNSILSTSISGLFANQESIRSTSNNIANVNTDGYNRTEIRQETRILQGSASGVEVTQINRVVDRFLEASQRVTRSNTSEFTIQRQFHDRLQGFLGDPASDSALNVQVDDIFRRLSDLALAPSDILRRQSALSDIDSLSRQLSTLENQIQSLRGDASQQIVQATGRANEALARIFQINPLLVRETVLGGETGGLEQQLSVAIEELATEFDITVNRRSNGGVDVFTSSGQVLVSNATLAQLNYDAPGVVTGETIFPPITVSRVDPDTLEQLGAETDFTQQIRSGELRGLLDLRDKSLVDLTESLGEFSARFKDELNAIHNAFSAVPPPNSLTGAATPVLGSNSLNFTGEVTLAVLNSDNTTNTQTIIDFDAQTINGVSNPTAFADFSSLITAVNTELGGAGTLSLSNGQLGFSATNANNGVIIQDDPDNPSRRAGRGLSHFFGMNDLIQSESSGIFEPGFQATDLHGLSTGESIFFSIQDNLGRNISSATITIDASTNMTYQDLINSLNDTSTGLGNFFTFSLDPDTGAITHTVNPPRQDLDFSVVSDNTQLGGSGLSVGEVFGLATGVRAAASRNIGVVERISSNPINMALAQFDKTALASGDDAIAAGDQRGALAFQRLETNLVSFSSAGELVQGDITLPQYIARFLGNAGTMAQRVTNLEADNNALLFEIEQRQSDFSGVNLDEELANLVIFQNAYGAAARILSSVQELYDDLLSVV